jgi:hypothetical protein
MRNMSKWMLGVAIVAGGLGLGATTAQAAEFGIYARGPVAYVPPCPGDGYSWQAGYMSDGYWTPGRWVFVGGGYRGHVAYFDRDHDRRSDWDRDRRGDFDRHEDRDRDRGHDRDGDHFRR